MSVDLFRRTEEEIQAERDRMSLNKSGILLANGRPVEMGVVKNLAAKYGPDWWRDEKRLWAASWWQKTFEKSVGPRNLHIRMKSLAPSNESSLSVPLQEKCINMLRAKPEDSYLMLGPAGCSKTTYAVALYDQALRANWLTNAPVWFWETKAMLDKFVAYATGRGEMPKPNSRLVENLYMQGKRCTLILEEMDKVKTTEYKLGELFDLINAIYKFNGQIVVTSNMTKEEFISTFDAPIFRRLTEMKADATDTKSTSHFWDFYNQVKKEK